jgi:hypothetical protein
MSLCSKEATQVECIDAPIIVLVDRSEGRKRGEVVSELKCGLQNVKTSLEVYLFLKNIGQSTINAK